MATYIGPPAEEWWMVQRVLSRFRGLLHLSLSDMVAGPTTGAVLEEGLWCPSRLQSLKLVRMRSSRRGLGQWDNVAKLYGALRSAPQLTSLILADQDAELISAEALDELSRSLTYMRGGLKTMVVQVADGRAHVSMKGVHAFAKALPTLQHVRRVELEGVDVDEAGAVHLGRALSAWHHLETLSLTRCFRGIPCLEPMARALAGGAAPHLHTLALKGSPRASEQNQPSGDALVGVFSRVWPALHCLTELELSWYGISDVGATRLATQLPSMPRLTALRLHNNRIGDVGLRDLAGMETALLAQLQYLDLSHNNIGRDGYLCLACVVAHMSSLRLLNLSMGREQGDGAVVVLTAIMAAPQLGSLEEVRVLFRTPAAAEVMQRWEATPHTAHVRLLGVRQCFR
jgi:Ran GTPase-activating protein (RanGAP) involved in mRNA processing and transport